MPVTAAQAGEEEGRAGTKGHRRRFRGGERGEDLANTGVKNGKEMKWALEKPMQRGGEGRAGERRGLGEERKTTAVHPPLDLENSGLVHFQMWVLPAALPLESCPCSLCSGVREGARVAPHIHLHPQRGWEGR